MERIATKVFDDDELADACRRVDIDDTQFWLRPPPMPRTTNFTAVLRGASRAGWPIRTEIRDRIKTLDSSTIAWVIDGLAVVVQDLQDVEANSLELQYLSLFYELVVEGYEQALAPLLRKAEEQGLYRHHTVK